MSYTYAATDHLTRFINRNDAVFGSPWTSGLNGTANGVSTLTVVESSAKSRYNGVTFGLARLVDPDFQYQANYTLAVDKAARLHDLLTPDQVYVVGDTPLDIAAAKTAGATSVGVATGHYSTDELRAAGANHVLGSLEDPFPGL